MHLDPLRVQIWKLRGGRVDPQDGRSVKICEREWLRCTECICIHLNASIRFLHICYRQFANVYVTHRHNCNSATTTLTVNGAATCVQLLDADDTLAHTRLANSGTFSDSSIFVGYDAGQACEQAKDRPQIPPKTTMKTRQQLL